MFRYARLKHDFQLAEYDFHRRENGLFVTPETVPFNNQSKEGKGPALRLPAGWYKFVRDLNTEAGFGIATRPATGWVNEGWENHDTPLVQSLSMGGNIVIIREVSQDGFGRLRAFRGDEPPPDPMRMNYMDTPQYVHKFTCISSNQRILNPGKGLDAYFPLIGIGDLWVPMRRVELFPEIPCTIQMQVTSFFRSSPKKSYTNVVGALASGQPLRLIGYAAKASSVWGYVGTEAGQYGYVALLWHPNSSALQYLTTWQMETVPPIPPK